ncbi:NAD(P)-dependent oxidoreductase [Rhodopseudomonas sp. NSM]|uniref:NAD(P)-dependent oxidoreductase n=1 Tax=Rhodopseudomonas sp. NSM TaxID=3457630 RepID=UPI0040374DA6
MTDLPLVVLTNRTFDDTRALFSGRARIIANHLETPWPADVLLAHASIADALMAFMPDCIDAEFLDSCPRLRVIGAALKGFDNIDVEAATARGVTVTIVPDLLTRPTAELAVGLTIALGRHILAGDAAIRRGGFNGWRPEFYGLGLAGSTVGIVGYGRVGQAIARCLSGFGCRVLACDANWNPSVPDDAERVTMDVLTGSADILILGMPLTPATQGIVGHAFLRSMKAGALLINPARGSLVDEAAVADALESGHLGGYAADVFACEDWARGDRPREIEPRLLSMTTKTVLTPHLGSAVVESRRAIEYSAADSILRVLAGEKPETALA